MTVVVTYSVLLLKSKRSYKESCSVATTITTYRQPKTMRCRLDIAWAMWTKHFSVNHELYFVMNIFIHLVIFTKHENCPQPRHVDLSNILWQAPHIQWVILLFCISLSLRLSLSSKFGLRPKISQKVKSQRIAESKRKKTTSRFGLSLVSVRI